MVRVSRWERANRIQPDQPYLMVNGQVRTIQQLRSDWGSNMIGQSLAQPGSELAPSTAALLYESSATAFVGINARASYASEIPVRVKRGGDVVIERSPAEAFLQYAERYIWRCMANRLIFGAYYFRKHYNARGWPTDIEILNPADVSPEIDYARKRIQGYRVTSGARVEMLPPNQVIAYTAWNPLSDAEPLSPLQVAMQHISVQISVARFAAAFFANSARPDGMLTFEGDSISEEQQIETRNRWEAMFRGARNAFKTFISGSGMGRWIWTPIQTTPADLAMESTVQQADSKILAVLQVNPVLVGMGDASDPLSATGTLREHRRNQTQWVALPDIREILQPLNEQWLKKDFPGDLWELEPDDMAILADSQATGERVANAINGAGRIWTINEAREHTGRPPLPGIIEFNPDWATVAYNAGGIRRSQYQRAMGVAPDLLNDGYIYEIDPRASAPAVPSYTLADENVQQLSVQNPPQIESNSRSTPEIVPTIGIQLQDEPQEKTLEHVTEAEVEALPLLEGAELLAALEEIRRWAKRVRRNGPNTRFETAYIPRDVQTWIRANLISHDPGDVFNAARRWVREGDQPDPWAREVYLTLRLSDASKARIITFREDFLVNKALVGNWDDPAHYHITLAYADSVTDEQLQVIQQRLQDEDQGGYGATIGAAPVVHTEVLALGSFDTPDGHTLHIKVRPDEALRDVQRRVIDILNQIGVSLSPFSNPSAWNPHITLGYFEQVPDSILDQDYFDLQLQTLGVDVSTGDYITLSYIPFVRAGDVQILEDQESLDDQAFWVMFDELDQDALQDQFEQAVAELYQDAFDLLRAVGGPDELGDGLIGAVFNVESIAERLAGTANEPGPLAQAYMAGERNGYKELLKATGRTRAEANVDWNLVNNAAARFAKKYSYNLLEDIAISARQDIGRAVSAWIESGEPYQALVAKLEGILTDRTRAKRVAQTEMTRAYAEGNKRQYLAAGVQTIRWRTVNVGLNRVDKRPGDVCRICSPLHNQTGDLATGVIHPVTGVALFPPAHPNCRCAIKPIVTRAEDIDLPAPEDLKASDFDPHDLAIQLAIQAQHKKNSNLRTRIGKVTSAEQRANELQREWFDLRAKYYAYHRLAQHKSGDRALNADDFKLYLKDAGLTEAQYGRLTYNELIGRKAEHDTQLRTLDAEQEALTKKAKNRDKLIRQMLKSGRKAKGLNEIEGEPPGLKAQQEAKVAQDWLADVMNADYYGDVRNLGRYVDGSKIYTDGRARAGSDGRLYMQPHNTATTFVHEIGHRIEDMQPRIFDRAVEFLKYRTKGATLRPLNEIYPDHSYAPHEIAFDAGFEHKYTASLYTDATGEIRATEVISMGLEWLYKDPAGFAAQDPEYFDFVVGIARGEL